MSLSDEFVKSLPADEQLKGSKMISDLQEIMDFMNLKGYLRLELCGMQGEVERVKIMNVLQNTLSMTKAFNMFFDMYVDKIKPDSKKRLISFLELNKPYGMNEEDIIYLLFSNMIHTFLINAEEFRATLLFILKLPIHYSKRKKINRITTLGQLLLAFKEIGVSQIDTLLKDIDYDLRNGLSHSLYWVDIKDAHYTEPHLHYSEDITFDSVKLIGITDLYKKTRLQSLYTNALLNVIADWFQ